MALTRILNNQVTDSSAGNTYLGINASTKVQDYSVTAGKLANNLTYASNLTVQGNLDVQGTTTTIDTYNVVIEDPLLLLAKDQTGSPTFDIGFIGERGSSDNIAFAWIEANDEFATVFTNTVVSNTTLNVTSYANFHTFDANVAGNLTVIGTTTVANVSIGNISVTGQINATGNITGGNLNSNAAITGTTLTTTGTATVGNVSTSGTVSATGNITGGNLNSNSAITGTTLTTTGTATVGNLSTAGTVNATGNVSGGNLTSNGSATVTTTATVGNLSTAGTVNATGNISGGNLNSNGTITGTTITTTGTATVGNLSTTGTVNATGNITGGNLNSNGTITGTTITTTGTGTFGNVSTTGTVNATGNVSGGNIVSNSAITGTTLTTSGNASVGNLSTSGQVTATGNVTAAIVNTGTVTTTSGDLILNSASGVMQWDGSGNIVMNNQWINNLGYPTQDTDAASKVYVDTMVATGLTYHQSVVAATTTTLAATTGGTITYTQPNGAANGIGGTISTTGSFNLIDDANVQTANTRILVKNEGNAALNGIYYWANATAIIRTTDADEYGANSTTQLSYNDYFFVTSGNVNKGSAWVVDAPTGTITFGTSNIEFAQFSSSQTYTANTAAGILLTGTVFSAKVDNDTTAFDGGGNIIVKAGANLVTPNIGAATGTSLVLTGNVSAGNASISGVINATGNITGGNLNSNGTITGTTITTTGTGTFGNVSTTGTVNATGNVSGGNIVSNAAITGTTLTTTGAISATSGTISTTGNINGGNINATANVTGTGAVFTGNVTAANFIGNISGNIDAAGANTQVQFNDGDLLGASSSFTFDKSTNLMTVGNASITGTVNSTGNITGGNLNSNSTITGTTLTTTGTATVGNLSTAGTVNATGNIAGGNLNSNGALTVTTTGTLGNLEVSGTGNIVGKTIIGNALVNSANTANAALAVGATTSVLIAVGNTAQRPSTGVTGMLRFNTTTDSLEYYDNDSWTSAGTTFTVIVADSFVGNGVANTFTLSQDSTTAGTIVSINGIVQIPTTAYSVSGNSLVFTEAPEVSDVIDARILTTTTTVTGLSSGSATFEGDGSNAFVLTGNFLNGNANGTGNIGSSTGYFNTIFATATSAQYADLAEMYEADSIIEPGTVVCFGGAKEVTTCSTDACRRIAGVVSTNPSYIMNAGLSGDYVVAVALTGRVPTRVTGTIRKGDMLVATGDGRARAETDPITGSIIGKALADFDGADGMIEVVVGRL